MIGCTAYGFVEDPVIEFVGLYGVLALVSSGLVFLLVSIGWVGAPLEG